MSETETDASGKWGAVWIDIVAFLAGLSLAWFGAWQTKDLVWSLWLASLVVGYAMIIWMIFSPALYIATKAWQDRAMLQDHPAGPLAAGGAIYLVGGLFLLAFFTVHFGMFHFVHSVFLNSFFPMLPGKNHEPSLALYLQVLIAYWPFVLVAALAERKAFRWPGATPAPVVPGGTSVKPADIAARKAWNRTQSGMTGMMTPYKNVIRLHLLIFFFAFASMAHLHNFAIYAAVYAVYFFPWRLVKSDKR